MFWMRAPGSWRALSYLTASLSASSDEGDSSGGRYASGEYRRGDRRLELHFRWSLGLVTYHVGGLSLDHAEYVRAVRAGTGTSVQPAYPGFSDDPLAAFRDLGRDLERFGEVFLGGSDEAFAEPHTWAGEHPAPKGLAALP